MLKARQDPGKHRRFTNAEIQRLADEQGLNPFAIDSFPAHILPVEDDSRFSTFQFESLTDMPAGLEVVFARDGFEADRLIQKCRTLDL